MAIPVGCRVVPLRGFLLTVGCAGEGEGGSGRAAPAALLDLVCISELATHGSCTKEKKRIRRWRWDNQTEKKKKKKEVGEWEAEAEG